LIIPWAKNVYVFGVAQYKGSSFNECHRSRVRTQLILYLYVCKLLYFRLKRDHTMLQLVCPLSELLNSEAEVDACFRTGGNFGLGHVGVTDTDVTFDLL